MPANISDRRLVQLRRQHEDAKAAALKYLDENESADGTLPDERVEGYEALQGKIKQAEQRVELYQERLNLEARQPPIWDEDRDAPKPHIAVKQPGFVMDPKKGFKDHTEFLHGVIKSTKTGRVEDPRLRFLVSDRDGKAVHQIGSDGMVVDAGGRAVNITAGSDEQGMYSDPYGGFFVPEAFTPGPLTIAPEADQIGSRTRKIPMTAPIVKLNAKVDKTHTTSVSGGLQWYRRAETDKAAATRMEFEQIRLEAHSLYGLAYATNELLASSPVSFAAMIASGFQSELPNKLNKERLEGTGVGQFEGLASAGCKITVNKETDQDAASIVYENLIKMRAQCWNYSNAVWLYNHDCLPQLMSLYIAIGTGGVPAWQTNAREGETDLLLGRPAIATEYCKTLGTTGDLILADWGEYLEGTYMPYQTAESMHVRFLENETCFRVTMMNAGAHWWRSVLTPVNGATLSPVVYLQSRT